MSSTTSTATPPSFSPALTDPDIYNARSALYRNQVWYFVASFIALVALCQFFSWVLLKASSSSSTSSRPDAEGRISGGNGRRQWSRLPLAAVNYFRVIAFRFTVDVGDSITLTYAEVFVTLAYIVAMLTWDFVNTTDLEGTVLSLQYWGRRAGSLAATQLPLVTALGTKNSIISYVTGVSYDKLNFFHRMTARVVFLLLWIHGASKASFYALPLDWYEKWLVRLAIAIIMCFTLLMIVSLRPIRARFYEAFFFSHVTIVLLIIIGGYFHAQAGAGLGYYFCPCLYIWGADRVLRLLRVLWFNNNILALGPLSKRSQQGGGATAFARLLSPKFVHLRVLRPPHVKWTPGQAAFLIAPRVSRVPVEAHPFTIASVDSRYSLAGAKDTAASPGSGSDSEVLEFYINVREGFTKRLAEAAAGAPTPGGEVPVKVWLDGPYGFSPNLRNDDTVVLVAGGSGVSLVVAMLLGVVSDVQKGKSRCRKLVLLWSIRDIEQLDWVSSSFMAALNNCPPQLEISIQIFHTGRTESARPPPPPRIDTSEHAPAPGSSGSAKTHAPPSPSSESESAITAQAQTTEHPTKPENEKGKSRAVRTVIEAVGSAESLADSDAAGDEKLGPRAAALRDLPSSVLVRAHRPNLHALLREEVRAGAGAGGRLSVTVCGSAAIARACREALRLPFSSVLRGGPSVVLHVESFGYA